MASIQSKTFSLSSGQSVNLRCASARDSESLLHMIHEVLSEQVFTLSEPEELALSPKQEAEWIEKMNSNPNHLLIIAEIDGKIVGNLDFTNGHRKRIAHTGDFGMSVAKEYREQGIGKLLLQALIAWAKAHPLIEKISLKVHANNPRAIHVYEKLGFKEEGRLARDLKYSDSEYVDTVVMGLLL
jgi:RimJ/RimL family protein N-acetyltransferase